MTLPKFLSLLTLLFVLPVVPAGQGDDPKKKRPDAIPEGLKALQHPDARVRFSAAQTLANLGPAAKFAIPELRDALKDKNGVVRVKVVEALWKVEKTPAGILLPVLLQALKDKDAGVRAAAPPVIALLGSDAKSALPALREALKDKTLNVKLATIVALGEFGPLAKDSASDLFELTTDKEFFLLEPFVGATLGNLGPGALPVLTKALADESVERRRVAAYALGAMGKSAAPATGALATTLKSKDATTRQLAARALGKIGPAAKTALPSLETIVTDKAAPVRIEAALATWLITSDAKHLGVLLKALGDASPNVRDIACQALATMKADAKDAVDPLAKLLLDEDLRLRAIITLGEIGPASARSVPVLKKQFDDKDGEIRLHAAFAVWQITGDAKESLAILEKTLGTEANYTQTIVALGNMRTAAAPLLPTLVALWREEDVAADRKALSDAIKKIDAKLALKLGIP